MSFSSVGAVFHNCASLRSVSLLLTLLLIVPEEEVLVVVAVAVVAVVFAAAMIDARFAFENNINADIGRGGGGGGDSGVR